MSCSIVAAFVAGSLWALTGAASSANAGDVPIDDFSNANLTGVFVTINSGSGPNPTASASDSGLTGVIGGARRLTVSAQGTIPMGLVLRAKVDTTVVSGLTPGLCANSSVTNKGTFDLLYDAGGVGLDVDLSQFKGILVLPTAVDNGLGTTPLSYKVTLVDTSNNSASATGGNAQSCFDAVQVCADQRFLFSQFSGVNLRHIRSIDISLASENAFDAIIGPITLFGSTETAPLLSFRMISVLAATLGAVGLMGMRRMRQAL